MASSLFDKLWDLHRVDSMGGRMDLVAIDLHLLHDLSGPGALRELFRRGLKVRAPQQTFATPDHGVATVPGRKAESSEASRRSLPPFRRYCEAAGITLFDLDSAEQGIVHVIGPELGLTLPGLSIVCGDSHTCTQGAFGALAWGIGSTEVMQVLAMQMLILERPLSMRVRADGRLPRGVTPKDLILHIIGTWGASGAVGHAVEFAGAAIEALTMEERMSLCNLAVEFGARFGFIAPDETTYAYLKDKPFAPRGALWSDPFPPVVRSRAVVLRLENVDTDVITPIGRVLQGREAVERFAFEPLRFAADGNRLSSDPFSDPERAGAQILVAGRNFGCGSSRETAAWAVRGLGLRVIIAPSYGDIFYSNCLKNGVLAVGLSVDDTGLIAHAAEKLLEIEVDLPRQVLRCTNCNFHFEIEPVQKEMLLSGLDEIGVMQSRESVRAEFDKRDSVTRPWVRLRS